MTDRKNLISVDDCPCDGCKAKPCGHPARCVKFTLWLNKTVDAAPVVHGRWEDKPTGRYGQQQSWCSACRKPSGIGGIEKNRHRAYCPNCGAKMDKED